MDMITKIHEEIGTFLTDCNPAGYSFRRTFDVDKFPPGGNCSGTGAGGGRGTGHGLGGGHSGAAAGSTGIGYSGGTPSGDCHKLGQGS